MTTSAHAALLIAVQTGQPIEYWDTDTLGWLGCNGLAELRDGKLVPTEKGREYAVHHQDLQNRRDR